MSATLAISPFTILHASFAYPPSKNFSTIDSIESTLCYCFFRKIHLFCYCILVPHRRLLLRATMASAQSGIPETLQTPQASPIRNVSNEINLDDISAKTSEALIEWLQEIGTIPRSFACPNCGAQMVFTADKSTIDGFIWTCRAHNHEAEALAKRQKKKKRPASEYRCNINRSMRTGTFFAKSKLTLPQIVKFAILWMDDVSLLFIEKHVRVSHKIAVNWSNYCRQVVYDAVAAGRNETLGGFDENCVPRVVEIDEYKFGKRKYNNEHRVEGQWVFRCFERSTGRSFIVPAEDRSAKTLLFFIKEWILPNTIVISDCWRAYDCLNEHEFQHYIVTHDIDFKTTKPESPPTRSSPVGGGTRSWSFRRAMVRSIRSLDIWPSTCSSSVFDTKGAIRRWHFYDKQEFRTIHGKETRTATIRVEQDCRMTLATAMIPTTNWMPQYSRWGW